MNIILCGLQHSGKTTIGKLLALKLANPFIDTDQLTESAYAMITGNERSCRQISLNHGESFFRELENQQIHSLKNTQGVSKIIACGGGSLCVAKNIEIFKSMGHIIYLKTPMEVLWKRIIVNGIPSYLDPNNAEASFFAIAASRLPVYEAAANMIIDTDLLNPEQITANILKGINYG